MNQKWKLNQKKKYNLNWKWKRKLKWNQELKCIACVMQAMSSGLSEVLPEASTGVPWRCWSAQWVVHPPSPCTSLCGGCCRGTMHTSQPVAELEQRELLKTQGSTWVWMFLQCPQSIWGALLTESPTDLAISSSTHLSPCAHTVSRLS